MQEINPRSKGVSFFVLATFERERGCLYDMYKKERKYKFSCGVLVLPREIFAVLIEARAFYFCSLLANIVRSLINLQQILLLS